MANVPWKTVGKTIGVVIVGGMALFLFLLLPHWAMQDIQAYAGTFSEKVKALDYLPLYIPLAIMMLIGLCSAVFRSRLGDILFLAGLALFIGSSASVFIYQSARDQFLAKQIIYRGPCTLLEFKADSEIRTVYAEFACGDAPMLIVKTADPGMVVPLANQQVNRTRQYKVSALKTISFSR